MCALRETRISQDDCLLPCKVFNCKSHLAIAPFSAEWISLVFFLFILAEFLRSLQRIVGREHMFSRPSEFPFPSGTLALQLRPYSSGN